MQAHSTIICEKCYKLLNKLDLLELEIKTTKDEIVNKYQETVALYGGRARRKKPAAAKKSEYVFPKYVVFVVFVLVLYAFNRGRGGKSG